MRGTYKKKPVEVEAVRFDGHNIGECLAFCRVGKKAMAYQSAIDQISILTLEGEMKASRGDYIIRGVNGEFYPCKPDIFQKTYDLISRPCLDCGAAVREKEIFLFGQYCAHCWNKRHLKPPAERVDWEPFITSEKEEDK